MIGVRLANLGDDLIVQELLSQLGYTFSVEDLRARLALLAKQPANPILLATENDRGVGLIVIHWTLSAFER